LLEALGFSEVSREKRHKIIYVVQEGLVGRECTKAAFLAVVFAYNQDRNSEDGTKW
jgi:hypothetical protein